MIHAMLPIYVHHKTLAGFDQECLIVAHAGRVLSVSACCSQTIDRFMWLCSTKSLSSWMDRQMGTDL